MSGACPAAVARADRHRAYIIETYHALSIAEQAADLNLSVGYVRMVRSALIKAGTLNPAKRAKCRLWTAAEWAGVVARLRAGATVKEAGKPAKRTRESVELEALRRHTTIAEVRAGYVWSANTLAAALGVDYTVIVRWIKGGNLKKARGGTVGRITRAAVERVLSDRYQWPSFSPDAIRDPHFRAFARGERIKAGGDWMSAKEYAHERGYVPESMRKRMRDGREDVTCARIGNEWFMWRAS